MERPDKLPPVDRIDPLDTKTSLTTRVYRVIRRAIERGEFAPGQTLTPERQLAKDLGVARITAQRALRLLEQEGFVSSSPAVGWVVMPAERWKPPAE